MRGGRARLALAVLTLLAGATGHAQEAGQPVIRKLAFQGNRAIESATLSAAIATTSSSSFATIPGLRTLGLGQKRRLDAREFSRDVLRLELFYRQSGFLDVQVDTLVRREGNDVFITFRITEGEPVRVTRLDVTGLDSLAPAERKAVLVDLPLEVGAPFNRYRFQASADTIIARLRNRGYPDAAVFRGFDLDRAAHTAEVALEVVPGVKARLGGIRVEGVTRMDTALVEGLVPLRPGRPYQQSELFRAQRNLYLSELFRFASVTVDTARRSPGDSLVPVHVRVTEGNRYRGRYSGGFGTNDCFRTTLGWTARGLAHSGNVFDVSATASKIGVGTPTDWGLEDNMCKPLADDTVGSSKVNYNLTTALRRPAFLGPTNTLTFSLFTERRSEYLAYLREETGGALGVLRQTARRIPLSLGYRLSYGRTQANPANFCAVFNACTEADIAVLAQRRWMGVVSAAVTWPRANNPVDPSRGWFAFTEAALSARAFGSSALQEFARGIADVAWYRPVGRGGAVVSWRVRAGAITAPTRTVEGTEVRYVPPEQRFYAGGPNDVRGYRQNELGPVVYVVRNDDFPVDSAEAGVIPPGEVQYSATGGNMLAVANLELRLPAPVWGNRLRFAAFVDAGTLWDRHATGSAATPVVRVTPGAGVRFLTPIGPIRLDVGYNPYDRPPGQLYLQTKDQLVLVQESFSQPRPRKYTIHFSVGQAF